MKPVDQTTFGEEKGNCFSACVATILEVPLEEVPFFMVPEGWWDFFLGWLKPRGYYALCFTIGEWDEEQRTDFVAEIGLAIMGGKSPRGDFQHAVVSDGPKTVHDPHPSRDGILSQDDIIFLVRGIA